MKVVRLFPHFFYCGNRYDKGDRDFIAGKLARLSDENKAIISEQYVEAYLFHANQKNIMAARKSANKLLVEFCDKFGIQKSDIVQAKEESKGNEHRFNERIRELKDRQSTGSMILDMADKKRGSLND